MWINLIKYWECPAVDRMYKANNKTLFAKLTQRILHCQKNVKAFANWILMLYLCKI